MEIEDPSKEYRELFDEFKKDVEKGMNLYYDLWTLIFDPYNDVSRIRKFCIDIDTFNIYLSNKFNHLMKFENTNQDNVISIYDQYLSNYVNDKANAKIITEK